MQVERERCEAVAEAAQMHQNIKGAVHKKKTQFWDGLLLLSAISHA